MQNDPSPTTRFPTTRYQGSKSKLLDWLWECLRPLSFHTFLDAFGGTGSVGYRAKQEGKQVTYNDLLTFNYHFGRALIENDNTRLTSDEINALLQHSSSRDYPTLIQTHFRDINFTEEENIWLDRTLAHLREWDPTSYQFSLALFALSQACLAKRPYNLFHRKNLYLRLANVERSFGNKTTWERPFPERFRTYLNQAHEAVFETPYKHKAYQGDAIEVLGDYDLVYIDPPYLSAKGVGVDYHGFYHFLEGITMYDQWESLIDFRSKHRRLQKQSNPWNQKRKIEQAFRALFDRFRQSQIAVSYRSDGIPSIERLCCLLRESKTHVNVQTYGPYSYALSTNKRSQEVLLLAT